MALKRKITAEAYEALKDDIKAEYKKEPNGTAYVLDTDDATELQNALQHTRAEIAAANEKIAETTRARDALQAKIDAGNHSELVKKGDVEALTKSYDQKLAAAQTEYSTSTKKLRDMIVNTSVDSAANKLAGEISASPTIMLPHIKTRLVCELDGDAPVLKVLGKDGKASALTLDDLKKEFLTDKEFSSIIIGSRASGSAPPSKPGSARVPNQPHTPNPAVKLNEVRNPKELVAEVKSRIAARAESNAAD